MNPSEIQRGLSAVCWHLPVGDLVLSTQETDEVLKAEDGNFSFLFPVQRRVGVNLNWWGQAIFSVVFLSDFY